MTKFSLSQQEPIIEIIDPSFRPLNKIGKGRIKSGIIVGVLALFSIVVWLSLKKFLK
jgi:hypothetical protein